MALRSSPPTNRMRAVRMLLGIAVLALGLWSGVRLIQILSADPEARWPDYLILIFPVIFLVWAAGLFHLVAQKKVRARRWSWQASALVWGASVTVLGVLRQTS